MSAMMPQDPNALPPTDPNAQAQPAADPNAAVTPATPSPDAGGFLPEGDAAADPNAEQRPVGDIGQDIERENMADPAGVENPTVEEQKMYDDFVNRAVLLISDHRKPEGGGMSPAETTLKMMNNSALTVPQAIGQAAAATTWLLHNAAKRSGVEYTPDVLFHGNDELIACLYLMGNAAGIFKGVPPYKGMKGDDGIGGTMEKEGPAEDASPNEEAEPSNGAATQEEEFMPSQESAPGPQGGPPADVDTAGAYDFSDAEIKILEASKLEAAKTFGDRLLESGQVTEEQRNEAVEFWKQQIEKEIDSGEVGDDILNGVDIDGARKEMKQRMSKKG